MTAWLRTVGLTKTFGGVTAIGDAAVALGAGEVRGVVGPNGAGKSTLMQMLAGIHAPDGGEILIDGTAVQFRGPDDALEAGIALVPQEMQLAPHLSVAGNIVLGREPRRFGVVSESRSRAVAERALERLGAPIEATAPIHSLTSVERRLVMVARALVTDARLIILDEPTAALAPQEAAAILDMVRSLSAKGVSVLYVSHRFDDIEAVADSVTGVRDARVVADLAKEEISRSALVRLVTPVDQISHRVDAPADRLTDPEGARETALVVEDLRGGPLEHLSFSAHRGEILGLSGLAGSGVDEVLWFVGGIDPRDGGSVTVEGLPLRSGDRLQAARAGVAYVPGDRGLAALPSHDIRSNISVSSLRGLAVAGVPNRARETETVTALAARVRLAAPISAALSTLSGGNQQKAIFARWMAADARVLLLHDPTAGVDVGARAEIHQRVRELAAAGVTVLVVSTDVPEICELADRVIVLDRGLAVAEISGDAISEPALLAAMTSGAPAQTTAGHPDPRGGTS
ncbi:sugar ABC transporter ATP-binding protein [Microbacterium sp. SLBN-111]|uniref:sugar ABC transporter ATP-binding protein n=1 Tax=Microbacterium sp. SLBN-111 TaxID=3377733 RepID=UPI003C7951C9